MFDLMQCLVGSAGPVEVNSTALSPRAEHISPADNIVVTVLYGDGSVGTLVYTALGATSLGKELLEIHSDNKTLVIDDFRVLRVHGSREKGWESTVQDKGHLAELREFAACVRSGGDWPISLTDMIRTTRVSLVAGSQAS